MVDSLEKNRFKGGSEKPEGVQESGKSPEDSSRHEDISRQSEALSEGVSGALESAEGGESVESGEVGEKTGEGKQRAPAARMKSSGKGDDDSAAPVKQFPPVEVMQVQISTRIHKEIVALEKQAKKMMANPAKINPFHLTALIAKIRSLREILAMLTKATSDVLRELWMKFVKNKH